MSSEDELKPDKEKSSTNDDTQKNTSNQKSAEDEPKPDEEKVPTNDDTQTNTSNQKSSEDETIPNAEQIPIDDDTQSKIFNRKSVDDELNEETLNNVAQELGIISLSWPEIHEPEFEGRTCFPESYYKNCNKEKVVLTYAENFRQQFTSKFPERLPLLLQAPNECGLQKMVCTTLRPTRIPYPELLQWQGCANLVADFLNYEPLPKPAILPDRILSPFTLLKRRKGNCFEYASLLVSLLNGVGYDSYVVVGRATRDVTLDLRIRTKCPLQEEIPEETKVEEPEKKKYTVEPAADFSSQHLRRMEEIQTQNNLKEELQKQAEIDKEIEELEKPPPDDLHGWRIHAWVLILSESRYYVQSDKSDKKKKGEIETVPDNEYPFYVEPSSGTKYPISHPEYLKVESVYNQENYYVNLQKDSPSLEFDLVNQEHWERLLCEELSMNEKASMENLENPEKYLDMAFSWVEKLDITPSEFEQRYPDGEKKNCYKKAILEKYSPYLKSDGMIKLLSEYEDYDYENLLDWYKWFDFRQDCLVKMFFNHITQTVTEDFKHGRADNMKLHQHDVDDMSNSYRTQRSFEYFSDSRLDHLVKVITSPASFIQLFDNREDRLYFRKIVFEDSDDGFESNTIKAIIEKYNRNPNVPSAEDINEKHFLIDKDKVKIVYHYDLNAFVKSTKTFTVPITDDIKEFIKKNPDKIKIYESNPNVKFPNSLELFILLTQCKKDMYRVQGEVDKYLIELIRSLTERQEELLNPSLIVELFNAERNEAAKESLAKEETAKRELMERDLSELGMWPGTPFMIRERSDIFTDEIKHMCLDDFIAVQCARQNRIQETYDKYITQLKDDEIWYLKNKNKISPEKGAECLKKRNELIFEIQTLEKQLERRKNLSEIRYRELVKVLMNRY